MLAGYQNKSCKHYYLPLHSEHPFQWVSSYQVLTLLHLKKHKTKPRYYNLPLDNLKTVQLAFTKEKAALAAADADNARKQASKNKRKK